MKLRRKCQGLYGFYSFLAMLLEKLEFQSNIYFCQWTKTCENAHSASLLCEKNGEMTNNWKEEISQDSEHEYTQVWTYKDFYLWHF